MKRYVKSSNDDSIFRFDDYEDVFVEDDLYLYACREPFNWAHMLACREYRKSSNGGYLVGEYVGADYEYLASLDHAPIQVAKEIIRLETRDVADRSIDDEDERESYVSYKDEMYEDIEE